METNRLRILFDADALVAFSKEDDTSHEKSKALHHQLICKEADFYVSIFTIPEAATVLSYKGNHELATKFLQTAPNLGCTELQFNDAFKSKANEWFIKLNKKGTSYFDCLNLALMELFAFDAIFSFDKIYKQNGFKLVSDIF